MPASQNSFNPYLTLSHLPLPVATRIRHLLGVCEWIAAQHPHTSYFEQGAVNATALCAGLPGHAGRKISPKTMQRLWYRWLKGWRGAPARHWGCLLDGRTQSMNRAKVRTADPAFIQYLGAKVVRFKRSAKAAIDELYEEWGAGQLIPGYEGCNYKPNMPLPAGWSYENLMRLIPTKTTLTIARQGMLAAAASLPQVFSTRVGCWPCSHVMFDDVWLDVLATGYNAAGRPQVNRPLQLGCLDLYTACRLCWYTKLRVNDAEDGHSLQLTSDEMLGLLCWFLYTVGYSCRGTVLVVENGTAAISREVEDMLYRISDGLIRVDRSGMIGEQQAGPFKGVRKGNPRHKASLEAWHNPLHNRMSGMLSHTGHDRREPEQLAAILNESLKMLKAGEKLPPERQELLMAYVPSLHEVIGKVEQVAGALNNRTDHALEGWRECGFTTVEFSLNGADGTFMPLLEVPAAVREMVPAMAAANPRLLRERNMSPQEAWNAATADPANRLIRFTAAECVALLGTANKFKLRAVGGAFRMDSRKRHHRQLLFSTRITTNSGHALELRDDQEYYGIFNPMGEQLFVLDERECILGVAPVIDRVSHVDEAAKLRAFGEVQARRLAELERTRNLMAAENAEIEIKRDFNAHVIVGREYDPLSIADARAMRRAEAKPKRLPEPASLCMDDGAGLGLPAAADVPGTFDL